MALFVLIAISFASMFVLVESSNAYVDDNICENYEFGIYDFPTEEEREIEEICKRNYHDTFWLFPGFIYLFSIGLMILFFIAILMDEETQYMVKKMSLAPKISTELYFNYLYVLFSFFVIFIGTISYLDAKSQFLATKPSDLEIVNNFPESSVSPFLIIAQIIHTFYFMYSISEREGFLQPKVNKSILLDMNSLKREIDSTLITSNDDKYVYEVNNFKKKLEKLEQKVQDEGNKDKFMKKKISELEAIIREKNKQISALKDEDKNTISQNITYNIQDSVIVDTKFDNSINSKE